MIVTFNDVKNGKEELNQAYNYAATAIEKNLKNIHPFRL